MARERKSKRAQDSGELPMTPMIDVVFQLLIYFIFTFETPDVIAHLDVFRPAPDQSQKEKPDKPPNMIRINIFPDGIQLNDRTVTLPELGDRLARLAGYDRNQTVLITCGSQSRHGTLVEVLDLCAKTRMTNLSVVSGN
jgi:biopolymer transport protein ExbD